jgi:hypothetical protein
MVYASYHLYTYAQFSSNVPLYERMMWPLRVTHLTVHQHYMHSAHILLFITLLLLLDEDADITGAAAEFLASMPKTDKEARKEKRKKDVERKVTLHLNPFHSDIPYKH